jgi:hypothetical protein
MNRILPLIGPLLFLLAQLLAPGGSPDPAQRQVIITNNQAAWELSHQIFAIAFAFLFWWLLALWDWLKARWSWLTGFGVFWTGFALLADFGIATLQFVALEAVRTLPADQALAIITAMSNSQNLLTFVYLPYLGFVVGMSLLAWRYYRQSEQRSGAFILVVTGLLLTAGGMTGNRIVLILAGLAWVGFTFLFLTYSVSHRIDGVRYNGSL